MPPSLVLSHLALPIPWANILSSSSQRGALLWGGGNPPVALKQEGRAVVRVGEDGQRGACIRQIFMRALKTPPEPGGGLLLQ